MRIVLIGDIGWRLLYHLGDEAMTEAAIDMLRERGVGSITLVAAQPEVSEEFYGLPSVTPVGFSAKAGRGGNDERLGALPEVLASGDFEDGSIHAAIRDCDAVIIAGGGNMNSTYHHLLYERVASKRIAEHFGRPLYVTSQTVGPVLTDEDLALVVEIADYARAFGAREAVTAALLREHAADPGAIFHTLDDAALLTADDASRRAVEELSSGRPFVVASFTNHHGTVWESPEEYYAEIAALCRGIAEDHDVDVLLAPHAGSLDSTELTYDQISNDIIQELAGTDRVRATRMITAREDVALIEAAVLSLSTRYHPTVFAPSVATPAIAIASSYYSSVRMRGALGNVGLQSFVIPAASLHLMRDAVAEAMAPHGPVHDFLARARTPALEFQKQWWDALVSSITSGGPVAFDRSLEPGRFTPTGEWSRLNEASLPLFDRFAQQLDQFTRLSATAQRTAEERDRLQRELDATREALQRYKNRKIIRATDRLGRLLRRR